MSNTAKSWVLLILLACIWGSSFILMKKGMFAENQTVIFSAAQVGTLRMLLASLVLLPLSILNLRKVKSAKDYFYFSIVGFCGSFIPAFLFTYAETGISSGFAGMMNSFTPIFTIILGFIIFNQRLKAIQLYGAGIGTIGIACLVFSGKQMALEADWNHLLAVILATFLYGISLNTIKHKLQGYTSTEITSLAFGLLFIPSVACFVLFDTQQVFLTSEYATSAFSYIAILAIIGTAFATFIFNGILRISSALFASSVTYLIPIVAVFIGIYFNEKITIFQVLSMFIILLGVLVANYWEVLFQKKGMNN
ncbi:MAG: DMT family transporter [Bacteroidota bacterium]